MLIKNSDTGSIDAFYSFDDSNLDAANPGYWIAFNQGMTVNQNNADVPLYAALTTENEYLIIVKIPSLISTSPEL